MTKGLVPNYVRYYEAASFLPQQRDRGEVERFASIASERGGTLDILDVGCAEGELSVLLAERGHRVTAADISRSFLKQTGELALKRGVDVATLYLDVDKDGGAGPHNAFDVIYLMDVIEHLRCPACALVNLRAMLRDNGVLVIHTPNLASAGLLYRYVKFRKRRENYFLPESLGDLHLQGYDYQTLEKTLNFAGLQILEVLPTTIGLPLLHRFAWARPLSRRLSKIFPLVSDTLLVTCRKVAPLDVDKQIEFWKRSLSV